MASKTVRLDPAQRPDIEERLSELGFDWEFDPAFPLQELNQEKSLRNQARLGNPLRPYEVERYKAALANGAKFPAIITATQATGGDLIVDGNHRVKAYSVNGRKSIPVYRIIDGDPQGVTMLTFESNTTHGAATSEEERLHHAMWMVDNGMSMEEAARRVGLRASKVREANALHEAQVRANEAGIDVRDWERTPAAVRMRLASITTDEGFAAMAKLTIHAGLSLGEVSEHVKVLSELRSSTKQAEYVIALRDVYAARLQRGGTPSTKGRRGLNPKALLAMGLGQLSNLPPAEAIFARLTDVEKEEHRKKIRVGIERLQELEKALG